MDIDSIKSEFSNMSNSIYKGDDKYYSNCRAEPIITLPSGSPEKKNIYINDILPSSKTCGTNLEANINSIATPDMCIQSLWKEAGCTPNGSLWNDISNGYFNSHSNGYWSNKKINDIKNNISDVYASRKFGENITNLCSPIPINNNLVGTNNDLLIKSDNDVNKYLINSIFKLKVNLPNIDPLISNKNDFNNPNYFYLAVEELETNCSINENNVCSNIYVDNKKCSNKSLSEISRRNSFRFVLVPIDYVNNPNVKYGKNINFTIIKINDKLYLKNVDTGYLPQLYKNDFNQIILSNLFKDETNINHLSTNKNILCNTSTNISTDKNPIDTLVSIKNSDGNNYLITTYDINKSNSIKFNYFNDQIQINLQTYNSYGIADNSFILIYCNYVTSTLQNIEKAKLDNNIKYNVVGFDDYNNPKFNNNKLNFSIEVIKFSDEYIKKMNVISIS